MLYMKKNNKMLPLTGSTLYADTPVGTIIPYTGDVAPKGYLMCYGQEVAIADYPELYDVIGDKFANGQTPTAGNFFLPDGKEATFKGAGLNEQLTDSHVSADGLSVGDYLDDRVQEHQHTPNNNGALSGNTATGNENYTALRFANLNSSAAKFTTTSNTGRKGNTTEVKAFGVNYIIKAKFVALPIDIMDAVSEEYATKEEANRFFPDYSQPIALPTTGTTWTATEDCYVQYLVASSEHRYFNINNNTVSKYTNGNSIGLSAFSGFVKKNDIIAIVASTYWGNISAYKLSS